MPRSSTGHVAKAETDAVVKRLTPLLAAFIRNPLQPEALCSWYKGLADHCPLWGLQERAYRKFVEGSSTKLVLDHPWRVMLTASEATEESFVRNHSAWNCPIIEPHGTGNQRAPTVIKPAAYADAAFAPSYVLHACRSTLLRRLDEIPLEHALNPARLRLPDYNKKIGDYDPDDGFALPVEMSAAVEIVDELQRLIVARDLAIGDARNTAEDRLQDYLRKLGVKGVAGKPSLPGSEQLVKALAKECRVWLPVERACQGALVSAEGVQKLGWWGCSNDPRLWAERLAFPFLTKPEIDFLRSPVRPKDDLLCAVYLIHGRVRDYLNLQTTADYALGTAVKDVLDLGENNPLCE